MGAGMLLTDESGNVLLVDPTYKPGWEIPGGVVEADESPRDAAHREVLEELGLDREPGDLLSVDWTAARAGHSESLTWIFEGGTLMPGEIPEIRLPETELGGFDFVPTESLTDRLGERRGGRMLAAVRARIEGRTLYTENGRLPQPTRARAIIVENDLVLLMLRIRPDRTYWVFPGGGREPYDATLRDTVIRECREELGVEVAVDDELAVPGIRRDAFFRCRIVSGRLGTGDGPEYSSGTGSYVPVWVPVAKLPGLANVFPAAVAEFVMGA
jgi:8-oxo-dGTP pyrophosphatase MutT (NUDIX family)